jgi:hypothetical protein
MSFRSCRDDSDGGDRSGGVAGVLPGRGGDAAVPCGCQAPMARLRKAAVARSAPVRAWRRGPCQTWQCCSVRLLVLLASPPMTSGQRTLSRLAALSKAIPGCSVSAVNLCAMPAADLPSLSVVAAHPAPWLEARERISTALGDCDELMAAWGLCSLTGSARHHRTAQLNWLLDATTDMGLREALTVGGMPRHPSRWHQFVSDVHGRTSGGTFEERLRQVLTKVLLEDLRYPPSGLQGPASHFHEWPSG